MPRFNVSTCTFAFGLFLIIDFFLSSDVRVASLLSILHKVILFLGAPFSLFYIPIHRGKNNRKTLVGHRMFILMVHISPVLSTILWDLIPFPIILVSRAVVPVVIGDTSSCVSDANVSLNLSSPPKGRCTHGNGKIPWQKK